VGIERKTIEIVTCDVCHNACGKNDGDIFIQVTAGDRDVAPTLIKATLTVTEPYGVANGVVCQECKKKYIKKYAENL